MLQHPDLLDVAVVPMPDEVKGEVPVAFVVERQSGAVEEQEIKEFFLVHGAPYMHPRRIFVVPALPLTSAKKIDRTTLKQRAEAAAARSKTKAAS